MTNISMSPFTDEIKQAEPSCEFNMPHFTSFKGDEDPERHLKHYRSVMILYRNIDDLMCKIFATSLQEYSSYRSIKKNPMESLRDYVKRFKTEKTRIAGCNDSIARAAFQK
ncbi:hypothetical protein ACFX2K_019838 [Malus domestica]